MAYTITGRSGRREPAPEFAFESEQARSATHHYDRDLARTTASIDA